MLCSTHACIPEIPYGLEAAGCPATTQCSTALLPRLTCSRGNFAQDEFEEAMATRYMGFSNDRQTLSLGLNQIFVPPLGTVR
jgi:hypothetical protein